MPFTLVEEVVCASAIVGGAAEECKLDPKSPHPLPPLVLLGAAMIACSVPQGGQHGGARPNKRARSGTVQ